MPRTLRALLIVALLAAAALPASAQRTDAPEPSAYADELHVIESALQTVVSVLREATFHDNQAPVARRLNLMTTQLDDAATPFGGLRAPEAIEDDDLEDLAFTLRDLLGEVRHLREELVADAPETTERLAPVELGLEDALRTVERMLDAPEVASRRTAPVDEDGWLRPGTYEDGTYEPRRDDAWRDDDWRDRDDDDWRGRDDDRRDRDGDDWRDRDDDWHDWAFDWDWDWYGDVSPTLGPYSHAWPFQSLALYRQMPSVRYNRVDGLVLGIGRDPLSWSDYDRGRIFGQVGYAFALEDIRYEVGAETRLDARADGYDVKIGGSYHQNTTSNDRWKTSWLENTLAAALFENDFFDYYETEGWSLYTVARVVEHVQLSAGYRSEVHRSLEREAHWSLFDGDGFRVNPAIDEGRLHTFVVAAEGGRIRGYTSLPQGVAYRAEVELGDGLGGDYAFTRYEGDVRGYLRLNRHSSAGLRLRGGLVTGDDVPVQKAFRLGGIGSMRGYAQNAFLGTRMLLLNAEYAVYDADVLDDLLDDVQLLGLFDAGWTNTPASDAFQIDDVLPSAGLGLGFDDRSLRLELMWPLRDVAGSGTRPSLWLRLSPSF